MIQDWGDAFMASLASALALFLAAIPKIIGFLLVVIIGWFIATAIAKAVAVVLRKVDFNGLAKRSGFSDFVHNMGVHTDSSGFIADVTKWFIRLIVLVVGFDVLGLPAVSDVLTELLLWLPNLIVALVVLVIGGLAARALAGLVRGATAEAGFSNPDTIATIAKVAVWIFAIIVAVNQIGIASTLINTLFMAIVFAVALAAGLAFGLGGRETAAEIVDTWRQKGKEAAPKMGDAADAAKRRTQGSEKSRIDAADAVRAHVNAPVVDKTDTDDNTIRVRREGDSDR